MGKLLTELKQLELPKGFKDAIKKLFTLKKYLICLLNWLKKGQYQAVVIEGDEVDLSKLSIQTCWPKDAAPLLTWGLTHYQRTI